MRVGRPASSVWMLIVPLPLPISAHKQKGKDHAVMATSEVGDGFRAVECRYPESYFRKSYLRVAIACAFVVGLWMIMPTSKWLIVCVAAVLALVFGYALQVYLRQRSVVCLDDSGLHVAGPLSYSLSWQDLRRVKLSYYSTRRDGSEGWMQLKVAGKGRSIRIDSDLIGFETIVIEALRQADLLGLDVGSATRHNAAVLTGEGGSARLQNPIKR